MEILHAREYDTNSKADKLALAKARWEAKCMIVSHLGLRCTMSSYAFCYVVVVLVRAGSVRKGLLSYYVAPWSACVMAALGGLVVYIGATALHGGLVRRSVVSGTSPSKCRTQRLFCR